MNCCFALLLLLGFSLRLAAGPVIFKSVQATFHGGSPEALRKTIDGLEASPDGWCVAPKFEQMQSAIFVAEAPVDADLLNLTLFFMSGRPNVSFADFSVHYTTDPHPGFDSVWEDLPILNFGATYYRLGRGPGNRLLAAEEPAFLTGTIPDNLYWISARTRGKAVTGFRINVFPVLRSGESAVGPVMSWARLDGDFVLTEFSAEVISTTTNVALGAPVTASQPLFSQEYPDSARPMTVPNVMTAEALTDGWPSTLAHPALGEHLKDFYFEIDLGQVRQIDHLGLRQRGDIYNLDRFGKMRVKLYEQDPKTGAEPVWQVLHRADGSYPAAGELEVLRASQGQGKFGGRYLRISSESDVSGSPMLAEVEVYEMRTPRLVSVKADDCELATKPGIRVPPGILRLEFLLEIPQSGKSRPNLFRWRVKEINEGWQSSNSLLLEIPSPPAGDFTLEVQAAHSDGTWDASLLTIPMTVLVPFTRSQTFFWLMAGATLATGGAVASAVSRRRISKLKAQAALAAERNRIARDMHDDVGARLSQLSFMLKSLGSDASLPASAKKEVEQINLSGLTVGKDYKVQFVLADTRDNPGHATILAKGPNVTGDSTRTRYSYTDGQFAVITASFTADATTAQFQPGQRWADDVPNETFVSGVQVLAVPIPALTWDNGASNSIWSTNAVNWTGSAWDNVNLKSAIFGATGAGTITLGEEIFAKDLTFNAPGYTITGNTLSLTAPIITTNAAAIINSTIDGMGSLIKEGAATLALSGTNLFTGSTTVNTGTLALGNNLALQYSSFNTASAGTLDLSAVNTPTLGGLTGSANFTLPGNVTSLTLNPQSGSLNYSGNLSGGAAGLALVKSGFGSQILSGTSDHSGGTTITEGSLVAGNNSALGSGTITLDGGTLSAANSPTLTNTIQVEGSGVLDTPFGSNLFLTGYLTGSGTVTKTGGFSLVLSGDNSGFSGTFTHSASNTILATASSGSATAAWEITGGVLAAGISDTNTTVSFGSLSGSGGTLANSGSNSTTTFSIGALGTDTTFSGNIQNQYGGTNNLVAITKTGSGILTLAGNNSYTGDTTVSAGTLILADNAQLTFVISDSDSNTVTGSGTATLNGDFNINTSAVTGTAGGIWTLVDRTSLTGETFNDTTFTVIGFDDTDNNGVWTLTDAKGNWSFDEATGELTLDIGYDYDTWKSANGVIGGENDDDDNDGLTNHEEYAFGLDPTGGSSVNPIIDQLNKSTGKFSYTRRDTTLPDPALNYTIWYSTDLVTWTEDTSAIQGTPTLTGEVETVEVTVSPALLTNPKLFIQVRAN